jgi:hypothetical protein
MKKTLLLLALALGWLPMALVAQTKDNVARECVLFEIFTGVRCPYCPAAANGIAQMMAEGLSIAPVGYHTTAFSTEEYYSNETNARASYYGINSYPTLKVDGITGMSGGGGASENMYSYYLNYYNQRINVASPFTIDLSYEPLEGTTCQVNCTVTQVGECNGSDVRVFIALTQCNINVGWQGMQGLHHVCRDMIPTQTGTPFTGPAMTISQTFEMNWPKEDCYLTAWVQNYSGGAKEVYQAVRMSTALDLEYDLVLDGVDNVVTSNCSGVQSPQFTVVNFGNETVTSFVMRAYDGQNTFTQNWEGTLPQGESVVVEMEEFEMGLCDTMEFSVDMPNGYADGFSADNISRIEMAEVSTVDGALVLQLKTGAHPENITFEIKNMDTDEVEYYYTYELANHVYREDIVLPHSACYRLTVRDAAGEGMGNGYFQVKDSNNTVVFKGGGSGGRFTYMLASELSCDGSVSIEENSYAMTSSAFNVSPNPSTGVVNLDFGKGLWQIQVFDIMGHKVMEKQVDAKSILDFSEQKEGIYLLKAWNDKEEFNTKIVIR